MTERQAPAPSTPRAPQAPQAAPPHLTAEVDHLVVAATTLEQGVAWCEATLGATPGPGGKHALFGTHNRLLRIESPVYAQAYLEIIAIDPDAPRPTRPRWFGLDDAALQAQLATRGPRLLHVVARTSALDAHLAALVGAGIDAGEAIAASRQSAHGLLQWRIAVRRDGSLPFGGALPTLIEWSGAQHPTLAMDGSALQLQQLSLAGLPAGAMAALGLRGVEFVAQSGAALRAGFITARGLVTLESR